jgi:hypothetical protein
MNTVHNPVIQNGKTCIQLALSPEANQEGIAENLAHELLHAAYFLVNQKGANIVDDVHQHASTTDPRPQANFSDILLKLKPYWSSLVQDSSTATLTARLNLLQKQLIALLTRTRDDLLSQVKKKI